MKTFCLALMVLLAGAIAPATRAQDEAPPPAQAPGGGAPAGSPAAPARPPAPQGPPPGMFALGPLPHATLKNYKPVTAEMLLNPSPDDWLQFSRTYDAWRYSPLKQINKKNVGQLHIAWVKRLPAGTNETIPLVHDGVIYTIAPGSDVMAIDGTNGDVIWEYKRTYKNPQLGSTERTKSLAIYKDMIYYTAPDGYVVALDANTGQKLWRFYNVAGPDDPGYPSWNGADNKDYTASTWGLPGNYDPVRKTIYWGIANPSP